MLENSKEINTKILMEERFIKTLFCGAMGSWWLQGMGEPVFFRDAATETLPLL